MSRAVLIVSSLLVPTRVVGTVEVIFRMAKSRFDGLTRQDIRTITGALRVAIEVYEKDRRTMAETLGHERLAGEFLTYRQNCETLLDELPE